MNAEEQAGTDPQPGGTGAEKPKEETYVALAELAEKSIENRRIYEWKVAFGLWTAIGVFTYFSIQHGGLVSDGMWWGCLTAYAAIGLIWCLLWQPSIHQANESDKELKRYYMRLAENKKAKSPWKEKKTPCVLSQLFLGLKYRGTWIQGSLTVVLLAMSFVLVQRPQPTTPLDQNGASKKQDTISITISGPKATKAIDKLME